MRGPLYESESTKTCLARAISGNREPARDDLSRSAAASRVSAHLDDGERGHRPTPATNSGTVL